MFKVVRKAIIIRTVQVIALLYMEDMKKYLSQYEIINNTLFWSPIAKYEAHDLSLRIEAQLEKVMKEFGVTFLYYVHPMHSLDGLKVFFKDDHTCKNYLRRYD